MKFEASVPLSNHGNTGSDREPAVIKIPASTRHWFRPHTRTIFKQSSNFRDGQQAPSAVWLPEAVTGGWLASGKWREAALGTFSEAQNACGLVNNELALSRVHW